MSDPKRIQRKRTKGWRMPEGTVYVGRPSQWGNPFYVPGVRGGRQDGIVYQLGWDHSIETRWQSIWAFRDHTVPTLDLSPLRGHDLACWCPLDLPCHADVLLEAANR